LKKVISDEEIDSFIYQENHSHTEKAKERLQ